MTYTECPHCGVTWDGKEIPIGLYINGNYTMEEAVKVAGEYYGWTYENKRCFSINMVGVETPGYDGVSYYQCQKCGAMVDRFTGEITAQEVEEVEEQPRELQRPPSWLTPFLFIGCFAWLIFLWLICN
jgi:hypothetical protein